jgi:hypothetical protein
VTDQALLKSDSIKFTTQIEAKGTVIPKMGMKIVLDGEKGVIWPKEGDQSKKWTPKWRRGKDGAVFFIKKNRAWTVRLHFDKVNNSTLGKPKSLWFQKNGNEEPKIGKKARFCKTKNRNSDQGG